jgi:GNAT superfamily N-acetyltransferase
MVREWDPSTAPSTEIEAALRTLNAVLVADLPDDPPWQPDAYREYLAATMPGERRICWLAQEHPDAEILGAATILLFGDIGVLDILVCPTHRRSGIGRMLLAEAVRRAYAEGFGCLGVEVVGDTPAVDFYEALGFTCAFVEIRHVLSLCTVDWKALDEMAEGLGSGYHLEYFPGGPPQRLYPAYAEAKELVRDSYELGDLELRPSSYDADRLAASLATLHARGMRPYIVVGIHDATGKVAGLTEVVVPAQHPCRADQYDTVVVPAHRGYGLGRAMKAEMLLKLREAEPQLTEVQTWNAFENESMLKVNNELGFVADRQWFEYEANVAELARRLGVG